MKKLAILLLPCVLFLVACGGGGGGSSSSTTPTASSSKANTAPISVSAGADPNNAYTNGAFASVTICSPGTTNCQTIPNILVDTGSIGLRLLASTITVPLTRETVSSNTLLECNQFVDSFTWGAVAPADVKLAGEIASSVPIQVIDDQNQFPVPTACSNTGPNGDSVTALGANGILGVGNWRQDCGGYCAAQTGAKLYYLCPSSGCVETIVAVSQQVNNPVWMFSSDNNGVVLQFPSVASPGATTLAGTMTFGIGTQSDNALGSALVVGLDAFGDFQTRLNGQNYSGSYIDSGSNGIFFLDANTTGIPVCTDAPSFYCPSAAQTMTAFINGTFGASTPITFTIDNADALFAHQTFLVLPTLGGPNTGSFAWGLPFFYGRTVFTAIEGQNTPAGPGPYVAY